MARPTRSTAVNAKGLEIWFEVLPDVKMDRIPMRTVMLHFKNVSSDPIRIYLPAAEAFRAGISTVVMSSGDAILAVPEPHPHGYKVTEVDFPLLAAGEEKAFEQPFSLDPMLPGPGTATARKAGFETGKSVKVRWRYGNSITRWKGGAATLDGPTNELFGGNDIPYIWTGDLSTEATWSAP